MLASIFSPVATARQRISIDELDGFVRHAAHLPGLRRIRERRSASLHRRWGAGSEAIRAFP